MDQKLQESSIMASFSILPDPRKPRNQLYSLFDLISTAILATFCAADDYYSISLWTKTNLDWLQSIGICSNGAPSHDTYCRFFRYLSPNAFRECFMEWTRQLSDSIKGVVAIDGKTLRGSKDKDLLPIHIVSAYSNDNNLILGQLKASEKSGELETIQKLLEILDIKGAIVTIDAAGCHKVVVEQICNKGGDYVIALKGNQGNLHAEVKNYFTQALEVTPGEADCDYFIAEEKARGNLEKREVWACSSLNWLPQKSDWKGLKSIACVRYSKEKEGKVTTEKRYYISSLEENAEKFGKAIRNHWSVENKLHWQLDVTFREDLSRVRKGNGAENLSVVRRATLNLLKKDTVTKVGIKNKRLKAGWDRDYLLSLIGAN